MKQKCIACAKKLAATLVALCLTVTMMCSASATGSTANQSVLADKTGVVQVELVYVDPDTRAATTIQGGTGFLINDTNVITCNHVITMDDDTVELATEHLGVSETTLQNNTVVQIVYLRDTTPIPATITIQSAEMDFAVLAMSSQLYSRTYLSLRSSSTVVQSETVYAMGFPALVEAFQDVNTFNSDDLTINAGRVSKLRTEDGVDYVQCSAVFNSGMSGGPLVDEDGCVVGIIQSTKVETVEGATIGEYYDAIAIDQVITALIDRGISYTTCTHDDAGADTGAETESESEPEVESETQSEVETEPVVTVDKSRLQSLVTTASAEDTSKYTEDSASALASALSAAQTVLNDADATQTEVDSAYDTLSDAVSNLEEAKDNTMMFIIIGVVAGVVVILVVVILVLTRKKKNNKGGAPNGGDYPYYPPTDTGNPYTVPQQPQQPVAPAVGPTASVYGGNETSVLNAGAGETSVLNAGAGETTLLNQNCGSLTRRKTGEKITINAASFVIGKEQSRVNYCVRDNSSVSRTHATITSRNGAAYITDLRATNGTFVNGVRLTPNKETALKDGDTVLLADEEFTYHTF